jgi:RNA polymerase sigma-70 factor (ECF subfamily)
MPPGDRELLDRLRSGDRGALEAIFRASYPHLVGVAANILGARDPAEDVAQEVIVELWRRRESLRIETSLHAYLLRATRNRALNHLRHERVKDRLPAEALGFAEAPPADRDLAASELEQAVEAAIGALPGRCREVFELSRVHGLTYTEIARTLNLSVKTVETQMGRALRALRERLANWLPDADV